MTYRLACTALAAALLLLGSCKSGGSSGGNSGADTTPPTIDAINGVSDGAVVSLPVVISATAHDDRGVTQFTLTIDGDEATRSANGSLTFSLDTTARSGASHTLVFSAQDAARNIQTSTIQITVNQAPVASLTTTSVRSGPAVLHVTLDASNSSDPDNGPGALKYKFDFDGDGTIDVTKSSPTATFDYGAQGNYLPKVTVFDGLTDTTVALDRDPITVTSGWQVNTLSTGRTDRAHVESIAAINAGERTVALAVAVGTNAVGAPPIRILTYESVDGSHPLAWSGPVDAGLGETASIFQLADRPGLLLTRTNQSDSLELLFALAADPHATVWQGPHLVASEMPGLEFTIQGLALGPKPAVLFIGPPSGADSLSVFCSVADAGGGQSWPVTPTQLVQTGLRVDNVRAGKIGDHPCFASAVEPSGGVLFSRCRDNAGQSWPSAPNLISIASTFKMQDSPLVTVSSNPAIAVETGGRIKFLRCSDQNGGVWPATLTDVVATASEGFVLCGDPAAVPLVCFEVVGGKIEYCQGTDAIGSGWTAPALIDSGAGDSLQACFSAGQFVLAYTKGNDIRIATF